MGKSYSTRQYRVSPVNCRYTARHALSDQRYANYYENITTPPTHPPTQNVPPPPEFVASSVPADRVAWTKPRFDKWAPGLLDTVHAGAIVKSKMGGVGCHRQQVLTGPGRAQKIAA